MRVHVSEVEGSVYRREASVALAVRVCGCLLAVAIGIGCAGKRSDSPEPTPEQEDPFPPEVYRAFEDVKRLRTGMVREEVERLFAYLWDRDMEIGSFRTWGSTRVFQICEGYYLHLGFSHHDGDGELFDAGSEPVTFAQIHTGREDVERDTTELDLWMTPVWSAAEGLHHVDATGNSLGPADGRELSLIPTESGAEER